MRLAGIASAWIGGMLMIAVCGWSTPAPGQEAAWNSQPTSGGPSVRAGHAMAYDSSRGVTVLFGGNSGLSAKTWEWNGSVWTKLAISGPTSRSYHAMAYDSARKQTVLFGGERISPVLFYGDTQTYGAVSCPADLNGDRLVDDADFQAFVVAYNILDCADPAMPTGCPADLNGDNMVDDADFSQFVLAYDAMVCG